MVCILQGLSIAEEKIGSDSSPSPVSSNRISQSRAATGMRSKVLFKDFESLAQHDCQQQQQELENEMGKPQDSEDQKSTTGHLSPPAAASYEPSAGDRMVIEDLHLTDEDTAMSTASPSTPAKSSAFESELQTSSEGQPAVVAPEDVSAGKSHPIDLEAGKNSSCEKSNKDDNGDNEATLMAKKTKKHAKGKKSKTSKTKKSKKKEMSRYRSDYHHFLEAAKKANTSPSNNGSFEFVGQ